MVSYHTDAWSDGLKCGVVFYDLETIHDAERGIHFDRGLFECTADEQFVWKERSQIIEFAAVHIQSGLSIETQCRPEFAWEAVRSPAAKLFAEDHGHDKIVRDLSLPTFKTRWREVILPFLRKVAEPYQRLAMVAHNGDNFDHLVLAKELRRLGLEIQAEVLFLDPIAALKRLHGPTYGNGGQLALAKLHERCVGTVGTVGVHHALQDCKTLLEIVHRWTELAQVLRFEISSWAGFDDVEEYGVECQWDSSVSDLRLDAPEFVPGLPWGGEGAQLELEISRKAIFNGDGVYQ